MEKILRFLEKYIIPKFLYRLGQPVYHFLMAFLAAFFYGFPSRKIKIIGVTGTKGKTTTCNLIAQILNFSGHKTGMATTVNFRIGEREWKNETKQTMLGRFQLQKLLARMAKENCEYAVIETSSEGILQYRHKFIDYETAVFTNLSPEHIERHNGFENYRAAKIKLFEKVAQKKNGTGIYNLDDENVEYFLKPKIKIKYGFTLKSINKSEFQEILQIKNVKSYPDRTEFEIIALFGRSFIKCNIEILLIGKFNVYNAAAAISVALSQNISLEKIKIALSSAKSPEGRMETIKTKDFTIIIDYAHEPSSLEAVYKTVSSIKYQVSGDENSKIICLLGAQGGGRDKWKRPAMGKIAAQYCDEIILTNEDPYDEQPEKIIEEIFSGYSQIRNLKSRAYPYLPINRQQADKIQNVYKIIDRKEAVKKALSLAKKGDIVVLTGKGGESWICVENGKKIPWDERKVVEETLSENFKI